MPLRAKTKHLAHQFIRLHAYFRSELEQLRDFRRRIDALATQSPAEINSTAIHEAGQPIEADHILGDLLKRDKGGQQSSPLLRIAYAHLKTYQSRRSREQHAAKAA